jgi:hypothetical protein
MTEPVEAGQTEEPTLLIPKIFLILNRLVTIQGP